VLEVTVVFVAIMVVLRGRVDDVIILMVVLVKFVDVLAVVLVPVVE